MSKKKKPWWEYLKQLSVVVLGIVVTFVGSDQISACQQRRELRTALQLVKDELQENQKVVQAIQRLVLYERHVTRYLIEHKDRLDQVPVDTLEQYAKVPFWWASYHVSTDAMEALKASGLMQKMPDVEFAQQLIKTYGQVERTATLYDFYAETKQKLQEKMIINPVLTAFMVEEHTPLERLTFVLSHVEGRMLVNQIPLIIGDQKPFQYAIEAIDQTTARIDELCD